MLRVRRSACYIINFYNGVSNTRLFGTIRNTGPAVNRSVADYYAGKSVFLTGATGFVGKVVVERLLYNCDDLENIYILIRPKDGRDTQTRLHKIFDVPLFERLKQTKPGYLKKVIPIEGDITQPELGVKTVDRKTLIDKVSVVFHSAATVRFIDTFQAMMNVNVEGTQRIVDLTKEIKHLEKFVYISTAFSNSHRKFIDEIIYEPLKRLEDVRKFMKDNENDSKKVSEFIANIPNPYTFSKSLAEQIIKKECVDIPTVIVRPSIVGPIHKEPLPGWVDSWVASTAIFSNVSRNLMPIMYGNEDVVSDIIPVDYVANLIILAGAKGKITKDITIYNICSSSENPVTWKLAADLFVEESKHYDFGTTTPHKLMLAKSPLVVNAVALFKLILPCLFKDGKLILKGKSPSYLKEGFRASLLREVTKLFACTSYFIKSKNTQFLISTLDDQDKAKFPCNVNDLDWNQYMKIYCRGVKQYLLKGKHE